MKTKTVGARELKTRLGSYLRQVREGKTLIVTDRGEPVAELRPISSQSSGEEATLEKLAALGIITHLNKSPLSHLRPVESTGPSVADAVVEDREDRL
jgi:prevent-host-death family protein